MKPVIEPRKFETFGTEKLETSTFKVKQSREMFKLLSSNIYSDKISAVIRELSANAIDAHKMADNVDKPFEVHLPNSFEPYFHVKDYGTGLSPDDVINLYSTYGESTKTNDNDTTGCFGIGSKSPFAYSDQFTITSRFNGKKYAYSCFVGEEGIPTVSPLGSKDTSEPNGLEIMIAVDKNDFKQFEHKARAIYKWYPLPPKIVGVADVNIEPLEIHETFDLSDGVKVHVLSSSPAYEHRNNSFVLQGSCAYPISRDSIRTGVSEDTAKDLDIDVFRSSNLAFEVPLGSINITASREQIEYDKPTSNFLAFIGQKARQKITKDLQADFAKCKTLWDASKKAKGLKDYILKSFVGDIPLYDTKDVRALEYQTFMFSFFDKKLSKEDNKTIVQRDYAEVKRVFHHDLRNALTFRMNRGVHGLAYSPVVNTLRTPSSGRDKHYFIVNTERAKVFNPILKHNFNTGVVAKYKDAYSITLVTPDEGRSKSIWKELQDEWAGREGVEVIKFSDLEEIPKIVKDKGQTVAQHATVLKLELGGSYTNKNSWKSTDKDVFTGGIYVALKNYVPDGFDSAREFKAKIIALRNLKVLPEQMPIFGIPASLKTIPSKSDKWVLLEDFLDERYRKIFKNVDINNLSRRYWDNEQGQSVGNYHLRVVSRFAHLSPTLKEYPKEVARHTQRFSKTDKHLMSILDRTNNDVWHALGIERSEDGKSLSTTAPTSDFKKYLTSVEDEFKLLFRYYTIPHGSHKDTMFTYFEQYVKGVELLKKVAQRDQSPTSQTQGENTND